MLKFRGLVIVPILLITSLVFAKVIDKTQAIVNGEPILESEFRNTIAPVVDQWKKATPVAEQTLEKLIELKQNLLEMMVDNKLLKQEAAKRKIRVSKREIEDYIKQFKSGYRTEAEFQAELKKENMTQTQFEKKVEEEMMAMKLARQEVADAVPMPTEEQTKALYKHITEKMEGKELGLEKKEEESVDQLAKIMKQMSSELVKVRHILVSVTKEASMQEKTAAQKKAKSVYADLKKGAEFDDLVKSSSDDAYSKEMGGQLGFITKDDERYPKEFVKVVYDLNVGKFSEPVLTDFGWHIIKVDEKKAARKVPYEEVANDLKGILLKKNQQAKYDEWVKSLRAKAAIKMSPITE
ncbi:MAG: peptidylprolyl isomerase [Elusimicrobiota bacterium]